MRVGLLSQGDCPLRTEEDLARSVLESQGTMKSKETCAATAPPEDSRLPTLFQLAPLKLPYPPPLDHACPLADHLI